jgi:sulfonate transport system substrate-binding protein
MRKPGFTCMNRPRTHAEAIRAIAVGASLALCLLSARPAAADPRTLHIGYQKYGTLVFEKARGTLEKRLAPLGVTVSWTEFLGGPTLLEAMGAGSIDFGITGDAPPIFAQAGGVDLAYVGVEPASPHGEAIIALKSSPIRSVADLRGKSIALNKGSNVHNLLVRVLAANGLSIKDVRPVYLKPSDARAAFENGSVDAWAIWDPYLAAAETALPTRKIADGVTANGKVIDENREYFLASRDYAHANADVIKLLMQDLGETEAYASAHHAEMVKLLAPAMRMDPAAVKLAIDRLAFGAMPVTAANLASQQDIADLFASLKLIPKKIDVGQSKI